MDWYQGLFYGYYDGITGLVREPVQGAKKEVSIFFATRQNPADGARAGLSRGSKRVCSKL